MSDASRRMSRVDTAWLRMDNDVNLMMIVGVWMLTPAVSLKALRERIADRLLKYERFRQKAVVDAAGAMWVEDERFDITRHVVPKALHAQDDESERQALQRLCGELAMTPLDPRRPLWQFHLVEDYEGGSALVARIHHCIGDGIALTSVMMSITDGGSDPPRRRKIVDHADDESDWLNDAVLKPLGDLAARAIGMVSDGKARAAGMLAHPQQPLLGSVDMARTGLHVVNDVAALALMPDDSPTLLKGKPKGKKKVAWSEPISLDEVKVVGLSLIHIFSDYSRNAVRMAALMKRRVIHVFTHDSIGLGEDGPTHQSVEHVPSLRLIPNLDVWRPADTIETAVAWGHALQRRDGPAALALSRQVLPVATTPAMANEIARGAYVLAEPQGGAARAVLIGTGSELQLALKAQTLLAAQGVLVRVVSMPCSLSLIHI